MVKMPEITRELLACLQCGYCVRVCETWGQTPWESITPRGKVYYLNQLAKRSPMDKILGRDIEISPEFVEAVYMCTGCAACETVCHVDIEFADFWERVREWLVDQGAGPMPAHEKFDKRIKSVRNPYGEAMEERDAWFPEEVPRAELPEVIFFAGCTASFRTEEIAKASIRVLHRAGLELNVLGPDEYCCTSPTLRVGITDNTYDAAKHVIERVERLGAKRMVTACAGCFQTVSNDFVDYYSNPTFDVLHFSECVEKLIKKRKLKFTGELDAKITYHDPCHLGRHSGVYEPPREVLKSIPGVDFVEMRNIKESSRCCGAGGGYKSSFNEYAVNVAANRVEEALSVGAGIIATACPFCVLNLKQGADQIDADIEIYDLAELVEMTTRPEEEGTE